MNLGWGVENRMRDEEAKNELATLRKRLRRIEDDIEFIRNESRRFKRMGFGRDYNESQLRALEEERAMCVKRLATFGRVAGSKKPTPVRRSPSHSKVTDVLIIPLAMVMVGIEALQPKHKKKTAPARGAYQRREQIRIRPIPAVDISLPD